MGALAFSGASHALIAPTDVIDCESYISNHKDFYGMLKQRLRVCNGMSVSEISCIDTLRDTEIFEELDEEALEICAKHSAKEIRSAYNLSRKDVFQRTFHVDAIDILSIKSKYDQDDINCAISIGEVSDYDLNIMDTLDECKTVLNDLHN